MTALAAVDNASMRLDDAVTWFLDSWPYEGPCMPTADTIRDYTRSVKWFATFAATEQRPYVSDVDADLLRAALKTTLEEGPNRSPLFKGGESTARALGSAVRRMLAWLGAQGVPVADLSHVKPPRLPERLQVRLTPEEFRKLEQAALHHFVDGHHRDPHITVARDLALLYLGFR